MNVSLEWLRAFVPVDLTAPALRDLLTARVAPVDEVVPLRSDLAPIVVARVVEEAPHPDSDHLHVTRVDAGTGSLLDVVCGAPNVTAGKLYPFAVVGTVLPTGVRIEKRKIRGAVSNGMLCSARELGLGDDQDGILELHVDVPPGTPLLNALPIGDARLVVDVGANRPDLLSHLGIAREVAAATGAALNLPAIEGLSSIVSESLRATDSGVAGPVTVRLEEGSLVRRFMGVVIRGVRVGPSPGWLVERLASVGVRSVNNVVDASNYVLHELGQPTHAFDLAKLAGSTIVVRLARGGEGITTLDGVRRELRPDMIVIADSDRPQAVAGVMGGRESEVTDATTDVFLEVANFDRGRVRAARRALGLVTDASYRFERGVDLEIAPVALRRLSQIISQVAGGAVDGAPIDLMPHAIETRVVSLRPDRVRILLGDAVPSTEIGTLIESIGFRVHEDGTAERLDVAVPSWREDVVAEVDLIEEVARLRGYDTFSEEIRPFRPGNVPDDPQWVLSRRVRDALVGAGLLEMRPMPFVVGGAGFVRVANPLSEAEGHLRRSVLDTLGRRAEYNLARMRGDLRLFEIGSVFEPSGGPLPREELHVGALVMGRRLPPHFTDPKTDDFSHWSVYDEWDVKALAELVMTHAYPGESPQLVPHPSRDESLWDIVVANRQVGTVRRIVLDAPVWASPAYGVEISLGPIDSAPVAAPRQSAYTVPAQPHAVVTRYRPLATTPAAEFDLALLVPDDVTSEAVERVIRGASGDLLEDLELFDRYVGKGVDPGFCSLAWRLTFRHAERTLREKEIEARRAKILSALATDLNVRPRT